MGSFKERISADLKEAMKARDQVRVDTLRSALSGFTYRLTEPGVAKGNDGTLTDADEQAVLQKQVKQRSDSIAEFEKAGRTELAAKELKERNILQVYLPAQKSADEIRSVVQAVLAGLPADARNQGNVMKAVMPQLKGQADGNLVREIVTAALAN